MQAALTDLVERVRAARADHTLLRIRAGGTKDFYGNEPCGTVFDPSAYRGIVSYEPSELVITARCGTPLAELEAQLAANRQMLAFEPPHFGAGATVGGCIAAGLSGPRRASAGAVRDFVLGAALLDGNAQVLRFGGTVMKNVAGYDVARLLTGSLGMLGVVLEASIKVLPVPAEEATLRFAMDEAKALRQMNAWARQPLPLSASCWRDGVLSVRLSGSASALKSGRAQLGGEPLTPEEAQRFWPAVREQTDAFFAGARPLWRLSLPSNAAPLALPGDQLIEWGGALRWLRSEQPAALLRERAAALGGHATLFRGGDRSAGAFAPLAPAVAQIHRRLKGQFDPDSTFNRGRLSQDL